VDDRGTGTGPRSPITTEVAKEEKMVRASDTSGSYAPGRDAPGGVFSSPWESPSVISPRAFASLPQRSTRLVNDARGVSLPALHYA